MCFLVELGYQEVRIASKVCELLGSGSRVEKLSTSRAALFASVVPQPKTPALHAEVIEWPFQTPSLSFENSSTSESPTRAAIFFSQLQSPEALFLVNSKTKVFFHSFCAPIAAWYLGDRPSQAVRGNVVQPCYLQNHGQACV